MSPSRRLWLARLTGLAGLARLGPGLGLGLAAPPTSATSATATGPGNAAAQAPPLPAADAVRRGRALVFPRDHGAHLEQRIEWWYATGWLLPEGSGSGSGSGVGPVVVSGADPWAEAQDARRIGFQVTFFRSRTGLAEALPGRLAPRHLLFAHAALTEVGAARAKSRCRGAKRPGRASASPVRLRKNVT